MNDPRDRTINNQYIQSEPHGTQYLGIGSLSPPLMSETKRAEKKRVTYWPVWSVDHVIRYLRQVYLWKRGGRNFVVNPDESVRYHHREL